MQGEISRIVRRLWNVVGRGRIGVVNDDGPVQAMQVRLDDKEVRDDTPRVAEYGFSSNPPPGTEAIAIFLGGDRSNGVVIATNNQQYRMKGLNSGDVAISDNRGNVILLGDNGIHVLGNVLIDGSLVVSGSTEFIGTVVANGHLIDESHTHHLGSGSTGTVT